MTDDEFRSAFHEHQDVVYRFLWRMAGAEAAEDLAQTGGDTYRLTFEPPSVTAEQRERLLGSDFATWKELPGKAVVSLGQTIRVRFTLGGDTFTLLTADQVAPGQAPFNLYVLHDPTWKPTYSNANVDAFIVDGADRAEYVVGMFGR